MTVARGHVHGDARRGLGALLRDLADGGRSLVRQEVHLTRLEMRRAMRSAGAGTAWVALGGVLILLGIIALVVGVILLIGAEGLAARYWLAALIVTVFLGIVAAGLALRGRSLLSAERLEPDETLRTLREDREWLKRRLTSGATSS